MTVPELIDDSYRNMEEAHGMIQRHIFDPFLKNSTSELEDLQAEISKISNILEHISERYDELLDSLDGVDNGEIRGAA